MNLKQLQQLVDDDWQNNSKMKPTPEQKLLFVIEEFGEVAEAIRRLSKDGGDHKTARDDLGSEFADFLISVITLANDYDIDLESELDAFWVKLSQRRQQP